MKRHLCAALILAVAALPAGADEKKEDAKDGFKTLFNGKDLTGWEVHPEGTGNWKVQDGAIVGSGRASHLFTKGEYADFHLRAECQINDGGNSGMYFRTRYGPGFPRGYEAQINSTGGDPIKTGSLYPAFNRRLPEERKQKILIKEKLVKPGEWFSYEVIAKGNHIVIKVNGKETVNFTDENNTFKKGRFAFQQHDPKSMVKVRKVEVKELKAE